jgi:hypothetical protein
MWPEYLDLMLRRAITIATIFVALTGATALVCAQTAPQQNSTQVKKQAPATHSSAKTSVKTAKRGKKAKQQEENIIPQQPPPPPPTPEQMPSVAPEVVYREGMLTINAPNSTMNDVLSAVRRVTGATIEKPPVGGMDRVVAKLGPGQPKDILESLFNGSRYDYIILGSATKQGGVDRIILTARANPGAGTAVAGTNSPGQPPKPNVQPQQQPADQDEPETDTEDMSVPERDQAEPEQPQPEQPQAQPQQPQGMPVQPPQDQTQQGQNPDQSQQPKVKSPDELLRELQQMQKQPPDQNQQQQEQPPPQ